MDLWIVAAATGAGYLAKYRQYLSGEKDILTDSSSSSLSINRESDIGNVLQQIPERPLPFQKIARKWLVEDSSSKNKHLWDGKIQEMDQYTVTNRGYYSTVSPLSSMPMICRGREFFRETLDGTRLNSRSRQHSIDVIRPVEALMPLMVTDTDRMIRRRSSVSNDLMRESGSMRLLPKKLEKGRTSSSSRQPGNEMRLLFSGIMMGVMASTVASESEFDKLHKLLKKSLSLVSDLREELELKDTLTMKELPREDNQPSSLFISDIVRSDQMTEIEAELEAELERLEFNMNTPIFNRISDFVELEPDYEADVAKGDLKVNYSSDTDNDKSGTTGKPADDGNYVVSPWELTLRLHELIESRLNSRIKELESKLDQNHTHTVESLHVTSLRCYEAESLSTSDSSSLTLPSDGQRTQRWENWTSSQGSNEAGQTEDEDEIFGKHL